MTNLSSETSCVFCTVRDEPIVARNRLAYAVRDTSPVTALHTLILPNRHVASYFDLDADEQRAIDELLEKDPVRHPGLRPDGRRVQYRRQYR